MLVATVPLDVPRRPRRGRRPGAVGEMRLLLLVGQAPLGLGPDSVDMSRGVPNWDPATQGNAEDIEKRLGKDRLRRDSMDRHCSQWGLSDRLRMGFSLCVVCVCCWVGVPWRAFTCYLFSAHQMAASTRPPTDPAQPSPRPPPTSSTSSIAPGSGSGPGPLPARASPVNRPSSAASKSLSPVTSRSSGAAVSAPPKPQSPAQNAAAPQDGSQDKLAEQMALVRGWRPRPVTHGCTQVGRQQFELHAWQ